MRLKFEVLKDLKLKVFLQIELDIIAGGRKQKDRIYVHFEIETNFNSLLFQKVYNEWSLSLNL